VVSIAENVRQLLGELPGGVQLVAAAKTRLPAQIQEAIDAGVGIIGENYVQEAARAREVIGDRARWHFIGHLQRNKVGRAVEIFDMIETVDSTEIAGEIDRRCARIGKTMPVLVEVNSAREGQKAGVLPEAAAGLIASLGCLEHVSVMGLMTMGASTERPEDSRPFFAETRRLFERIRGLGLPGVDMRYLSMGMTDTYKIAVAEGANIVRIGSLIFGPRVYGVEPKTIL
jgi:pyridoxal phosphate enzyme (YggS family)